MKSLSSEDFKFAELPAPRNEYASRVNKMDDYFSGQHEKILFKINSEASKVLNIGGE